MQNRQALLDFDGRRLTGARPFAIFESKNGSWRWTTPPDETFTAGSGNGFGILDEIRRGMAWGAQVKGARGAAIGYFAYDFARTLEPREFSPNPPPDDLPVPDVRLVFYEELRVKPPGTPNETAPSFAVKAAPGTDPDYEGAIDSIRDYIAAGDIYQANYTRRFIAKLPCPPGELYARLRERHPAPFAALLEWDDLALVSNSPERFLKLEGKKLISQPIKGTIARDSDPAQDERNKATLYASAKDRAENVMIVDLLRNDFGRVCEYGSVRVPQLFEVQSFPTLHHLVSTVSGTLGEGRDGLDAFAAAFPCGSITGAPKFRAMQIIDELEPVRRGASFGALGYFGFDGDMEWNVAIRTMTCRGEDVYFHTGGGIVWDSNARDEYAELQLKAIALRSVLS